MPNQANDRVSPEVRMQIAQLLGREPRGLEDVAVCGSGGEPMVIRVSSLVDDKPFPNLFWLIDPALVYRIDGDEAGGLIRRFQQQADDDPDLRRDMAMDHSAHIELRNGFMGRSVEEQLRKGNYYEVLQQRGIGGIADFGRVRCLHTWYAAHLVIPNTIGFLLDRYWAEIDKVV